MGKRASKLFSLKEWLTIPDAAKYLSLSFGEEVTPADVLRFGADERLRLSVYFVNHATARRGRLVPLEQCKVRVWPSLKLAKEAKDAGIPIPSYLIGHDEFGTLPEEVRDGLESDDWIAMPDGLAFPGAQFLLLEKNVSSISGVWDLPMVGGEHLDIEHQYQMETGGPEVTLSTLDGAFVEREGVVCQLQEDYEDNQYCAGSKAALERLKETLAFNDAKPEEVATAMAEYREQRKIFLQQRSEGPASDKYFPAGGLPSDSVVVVRTSALRDFERDLDTVDTDSAKPLSHREETTYLNIIGGLLHLMRAVTPAGKPQSVFESESAIVGALLAEFSGKPGITKRTLEGKFAEAKRGLSAY
jgi:hypothetical protein